MKTFSGFGYGLEVKKISAPKKIYIMFQIYYSLGSRYHGSLLLEQEIVIKIDWKSLVGDLSKASYWKNLKRK